MSARLALAAAILAAYAPMVLAADAQHGAEIAAQGTAAVPACAQCHAFNGGSDASGAFPRIAGQSAFYLGKALRDFAGPARDSGVMSPIAKALSADDIADLAAYYAGASAPNMPLKKPDAKLVKRGAELANAGDAAKGLQSCNSCHGPGGTGEPPGVPYLAGQYAHYTAFALDQWRRGLRKTSDGAMAEIAAHLGPDDAKAVAAYFQQVPGPDSLQSKE